MEILGWPRTTHMGTEKVHCQETPPGEEETLTAAELLSIDIETVSVENVVAQPGDTMGLLA